ncbi:MAG: ArnT family glycosyltransferase, partial [Burkholderiaceae bacterium]
MKTFTELRVPAAWVVLCAALWLCVGLFGREPYKPDEAYTVGLVKSIVESGDWVVPQLVGEPFMEKPPLFYVVAAIGAQATRPWVPLHEGARLAVLLFVGAGLLAIGAAARALYGQGAGASAVLLLLATFGAVFRLHQLITDTALFAGIAIGQHGLIVARVRDRRGGIALGLGAAVAFMAKGLLGIGILGLASVLLLSARQWRTREYVRALAWATAVAVPLVAVWPTALYLRSPELFHVWFWDNNIGRFLGLNSLGPKNEPLFYLRLMPWYAWPCWPLVAWWGYRRIRGLAPTAGAGAPLALFAVGFAVLSLASDARELYALVLLPPLAVLAAGGVRFVGARVQLQCARAAAVSALLLAAFIVGVWVIAWNDPTFVRRLP